MFPSISIKSFALLITSVACITIPKINGNHFVSPLSNMSVSNVQGLVTATGPKGFWLRTTTPDNDTTTSDSIYIYSGSNSSYTVASGNKISLSGTVTSYRSTSSNLYLTEVSQPSNITVKSANNSVVPLTLGLPSTSPPTSQLSSLDDSSQRSQITTADPALQPDKYGLDFWQSLLGDLVLVPQPHAVNHPNSNGETFVVGNWTTTSVNARTGLTLTSTDYNPEAILIGSPLDGTSSPTTTKLGDSLEDIVGVVYQQSGHYYILPLTAIKVTASLSPALPSPASFVSTGTCSGITVGQYNVDNLNPSSPKISQRARDIVTYLGMPDLVFLQEVQDNNGPEAGQWEVTGADDTLDNLLGAILDLGGPLYSYTYISPLNNEDDRQTNANIRVAYLYKSKVLQLHTPTVGLGTATDTVNVSESGGGRLVLNYNPGRIEPNSAAWKDSRKPLVVQWDVVSPANSSQSTGTFFTVNVHWTARLGSSSTQQANLTATFAQSILDLDRSANAIVAGDFNDFDFGQPLRVFGEIATSFESLDKATNIPDQERYSYLFEQNGQQLDHFFVSDSVAGRGVSYEHVHVNTWVSGEDQASDHDPSVAQVNVCS